MILDDLREFEKLDSARSQPRLCLMHFSLVETLQDVWTRYFRDAGFLPEIFFIDRGPLACICPRLGRSTIYVHNLLNHPDTPKTVIGWICKHELLHLRIPPRIVKGRLRQHPPEFWEVEDSLAPERCDAWEWLWRERGRWLKLRSRLERIDVRRNWKEVWDTKDLPARVEDVLPQRLRIELMEATGRFYL